MFYFVFLSENTTLYPELGANSQRQTMQILLLSGVTFIGILGLCIIGFCGINKYRHSKIFFLHKQ